MEKEVITIMEWTKGNNIVLIGMPGAGKSTIGVILAKIMGYRFVDADIVIQEQEGRLLKDIIEEEGVDGFINIENRVNRNINIKNGIIATGGSAVYGTEAMEHYKQTATIVYLNLDYCTLKNRLSDIKGRGVVLREGQTLKDIYNERTALYEKYADIIIDESGLNQEETVQALLEIF